jgi:hypothetical protein
MANATTTKVPSTELAEQIAALTEEGRRIERPFVDFASRARQTLREFEAEVDRAGIDEDEQALQEAAQPLAGLHRVLDSLTAGSSDLFDCLFGDPDAESEAGVAA